jgi:hypothetical protein
MLISCTSVIKSDFLFCFNRLAETFISVLQMSYQLVVRVHAADGSRNNAVMWVDATSDKMNLKRNELGSKV